jgi:hypothetical protein
MKVRFEMVYPGHAHEMWLGKEAWQKLSDSNSLFGGWIDREPYRTSMQSCVRFYGERHCSL